MLRAVESCDGDALHAVFTEPGVRRFLFDDVSLTRAETQIHVEAAREQGGWAICDDGQVVGLVCLRPIGEEHELIIALSRECWGKGVAFEAGRAALNYGFEVLKLVRIQAAVDSPNDRSHRLMVRLGFTATGEKEGVKYPLRTYEAFRRSGT